VLPAACLWFGPALGRDRDAEQEDLPGPPGVPQPREEPEVPQVSHPAARRENPVR